jgi:hypothetical protein
MQSAASGFGGTDSVTPGAFTLELINPDTEADAVTRFLASASSVTTTPCGPDVADIFDGDGGVTFPIFGLWENRAAEAGLVQFGYQSGTYQLNVSNIIPGISYHYVVVWESRDATGDGSGDTSGYGATWTNSDAQSGDFTPTGTTYNITGLTVPVHQGQQTRIKSITITPNP